jgi:hypothetical protein
MNNKLELKQLPLAEVFTFSSNNLRSVNMTSLYRLTQEPRPDAPPLTLRTLTSNPAMSLVPSAKPRVLVTSPANTPSRLIPWVLPKAQRKSSRPGSARLQARESLRKYSIGKVSGSLSRQFGTSAIQGSDRVEIELPPGLPQFVNAETLKAILNAQPSELLLKKTSSGRWEICPDSIQIDLMNPSEQYRLGDVQIYS